MKCKLHQIMIATTPILFFIAPTVFAGSFYLKPPDSIYASMASLMAVVSMIMCGCFGVAATYAFQAVLDEHYILLTIPLRCNFQLHWIDYVGTKKSALVKEKTEWSLLPTWFKILYFAGAMMMTLAGYLFYFFTCFANYDLSKMSVEDCSAETVAKYPHLVGKSKNGSCVREIDRMVQGVYIKRPIGLMALGVFFGSWFVYWLSGKYLKSMANEDIMALEARIDEEKTKWLEEQEATIAEGEKKLMAEKPADYDEYLTKQMSAAEYKAQEEERAKKAAARKAARAGVKKGEAVV